MTDQVLPDPIECVRLWATSRPRITELVETRIGISLSSDQASIRLAVIGGQHAPELGDPLLQLECWGAANQLDDGSASTIARTVLAEIPTLRGVWAGGRVVGAAVDSWPYASPDPKTSRPRYVLTLRLVIAPEPSH